MNILPKKSWHVRNKDNVARVRRDEAEAAELERKRKAKVDLAEQEARTDFLRKKLKPSSPGSSLPLVIASQQSAHLNLFQDAEEGSGGAERTNKEYEEEKIKEKQRQEKALGILTYLGQSASEAQTARPWYQDAPSRHKDADDATKQERLKAKLDPLHDMEKYLRGKTKEKKKRSEGKSHSKSAKEEARTSNPSIERLRQERLKRETAERARAEALLSGAKKSSAPEQEMDDRKRRYNSQFNPEIARRPKRYEESWRDASYMGKS